MKTILLILSFVSCLSFLQAQTFTYIDFGRGTEDDITAGNWNNASSPGSQSVIIIEDLIDSNGANTGVRFAIEEDVFNNVNTAGTDTPDPGLPFPSTATSDSFFGSTSAFGGATEPTGGFKLTGLNPTNFYSFAVFASRSATDNREAQYTVAGSTTKSATLDAASNMNNIATIIDIQPTASGEITFTAQPGPNNSNGSKFYYLGAVEMITTIVTNTITPESFNLKYRLGLYPNPVDDLLQIKLSLKEKSNLNLSLFDLSGRFLTTIFEGESANDFHYKWERPTSSKFRAGMYLLKIKVNNNQETTRKIVFR